MIDIEFNRTSIYGLNSAAESFIETFQYAQIAYW